MLKKMPDFEQVNVLVVGDIMLDRYFWGKVNRVSPEAPVAVVKKHKTSQTLGGAGNVAANLAGLGCGVTVLGICGADDDARTLKNLLDQKHIAHHLTVDTARPTTTKTRVMANRQQVLRIDDEDSRPLSEDVEGQLMAAFKQEIDRCRAVILSDYGKGIFNTRTIIRDMIAMARKAGLPVLVDPKGRDWERYRGATCITPNTAELEAVAGEALEADETALIAAGCRIREDCDLEWLLVTRGANGMCLIDARNGHHLIPARAREVYDVSGAGDTVIATLAASLGAGDAFIEAAETANLAAGVVVGKLGTQPVYHSELASVLQFPDSPYPATKLIGLEAGLARVREWTSAGDKVVFTNGCFDLLHPGHISLLHKARAFGDRLVVGLNSDASVRRLKGESRPFLSELDRAAMLGALACVDLVIPFEEDTPLALIDKVRPHILVKGSDYTPEEVVGKAEVEAYGGCVQLVELVEGYSTTGLSRKVNAAVTNK